MRHFARLLRTALVALVCTLSLADRSIGQIAFEVAKLLPEDGAVEDYFGWSVAISGEALVKEDFDESYC